MSPTTPSAIKEPKTQPQNLREIRAFLLKPGPDLDKLEGCFDAVVEGRYESLLYEMVGSRFVIQIVQAMVASRPTELVELLNMLEANIFSKYLTERNENFTSACLIGLIKGVTIINNENMRYLLKEKNDVAVRINERFVRFAVFLLKQNSGIETETSYKAELSDAIAGFVGDTVTITNNEWTQLCLLVKAIVAQAGLPGAGRTKPKNFVQAFFDELTFKIWSRSTTEVRLRVLTESLMK